MSRYEEIFKTLIGFDTTSCYSNMELINWVRDYLGGYGIESHLVRHESEDKANLFATIGGQGRGVALSGHTDVVPIAGQDWLSDPFSLLRGEDRYFGRGTCDMKGFIAVALSRVSDMVSQPLRTPLHFALSYDEEVGCLGAPRMIAEFGKQFIQPRVVIVGEPSNMQVVSGHKGMSHFHTRVHGIPRHSSQVHLGASSIFYACQFIGKLVEVSRGWAKDFDGSCGFEPPYSTISVGIINGGTAENIVPEHCEFFWECRTLPSDNPAEILEPIFDFQSALNDEMRVLGANGFTTESFFAPAFAADIDSAAERLVRSLTGDNQERYVSYSTEAGHFQQSGCAAVICGPGSIDQAHRQDEFVTIEQMDKCEIFMDKLVDFCRYNEI